MQLYWGGVEETTALLTEFSSQFLDVMVPQSIFEKAGNNKSGAAVLVWVRKLDEDPDTVLGHKSERNLYHTPAPPLPLK